MTHLFPFEVRSSRATHQDCSRCGETVSMLQAVAGLMSPCRAPVVTELREDKRGGGKFGPGKYTKFAERKPRSAA